MAQNTNKNPNLTDEQPGNGNGGNNGGGNGNPGGGNGGNNDGGNAGGGNAGPKDPLDTGGSFLYFYHPDHLGSTSYVTDANAEIYEHIEYFPFGETWVEEATNTYQRVPYRYTSKELDEETGLYYYGARYYDPRTSVWQSADPILGKYLPTGNKKQDAKLPGMGGVFNTPNLGLYTYTHQNPMRLIDPDGNAVFRNADALSKAAMAVLSDPTVQAGYLGATSWCNRGVGLIEKAGGNTSSYGNGQPGQYLMANDMIAKLQNKEFATPVSAKQAVEYAKQGATVIAGTTNKGGSGHVAIVAPKDMVKTSKWGSKMVPQIFNVGPGDNSLTGVNWGFGKKEPKYYIRNQDLKTLQQRNANANLNGSVGDFPTGDVFPVQHENES